MPTIVCITLFLIMYFFLIDNNDTYVEQLEYITCSECGDKVSISYDDCPNCKLKLNEECTYCKKKIDINWRYCPYCGTTKENR